MDRKRTSNRVVLMWNEHCNGGMLRLDRPIGRSDRLKRDVEEVICGNGMNWLWKIVNVRAANVAAYKS